MAEIALWNTAREALGKAEEANQRAEGLAHLVKEQGEEIDKLKGELKAMKARMGKKQE